MDDLAEFPHFPTKFIDLSGQIVIAAAGSALAKGIALTLLHLLVDLLLHLMSMSSKFMRLFHHVGCFEIFSGSHHMLNAIHHFVQLLVRIRHTLSVWSRCMPRSRFGLRTIGASRSGRTLRPRGTTRLRG